MSVAAYRTLARLGARREEAARAAVAAAQAAVQAAQTALAEAAAPVERFAVERRRREQALHAEAIGRVMGLGELERWRDRCTGLADQARDLAAAAAVAGEELDRTREELAAALERWRAARRAAEARDRLADRALASLDRTRERRAELELDDLPARPA